MASKPSYRPRGKKVELRRKKIVLHLDRNSVALLIDAIEEMIEEYQDDFGMGEERQLRDLLTDRLHRHDGSHEYRKAVPRA